MKNVLLTAALIAAAVASGDLLAQATALKTPPSRLIAAAADQARLGAPEGRLRTLIARLESEKTPRSDGGR